jgi:hypothetical protein
MLVLIADKFPGHPHILPLIFHRRIESKRCITDSKIHVLKQSEISSSCKKSVTFNSFKNEK